MNIKIPIDKKSKILNSGDFYGVMQRVLLRERKIDRNKEHFWAIDGVELEGRGTFRAADGSQIGAIGNKP